MNKTRDYKTKVEEHSWNKETKRPEIDDQLNLEESVIHYMTCSSDSHDCKHEIFGVLTDWPIVHLNRRSRQEFLLHTVTKLFLKSTGPILVFAWNIIIICIWPGSDLLCVRSGCEIVIYFNLQIFQILHFQWRYSFFILAVPMCDRWQVFIKVMFYRQIDIRTYRPDRILSDVMMNSEFGHRLHSGIIMLFLKYNNNIYFKGCD